MLIPKRIGLVRNLTSMFSAKPKKQSLMNSPNIIRKTYTKIKAPGSTEKINTRTIIQWATTCTIIKPNANNSLSRTLCTIPAIKTPPSKPINTICVTLLACNILEAWLYSFNEAIPTPIAITLTSDSIHPNGPYLWHLQSLSIFNLFQSSCRKSLWE